MKLALFALILAGLGVFAWKEFQAGEAHAAAKRPHFMVVTLTSTFEPVDTLKACELPSAEWANDSIYEDSWVQTIKCLPWGK